MLIYTVSEQYKYYEYAVNILYCNLKKKNENLMQMKNIYLTKAIQFFSVRTFANLALLKLK